MEVDDEYEWMEEASYKLVDGPLPVSKRQQKNGLGPSAYISVFNSIEALEKNYLGQSPSHSLTDPVLRREREGVLNRIVIDKLAMKNRYSGPVYGNPFLFNTLWLKPLSSGYPTIHTITPKTL